MEPIEVPRGARRLREARLEAGLSQRELALLSGRSIATISNFEAGLLPRHGRALGDVWQALEQHLSERRSARSRRPDAPGRALDQPADSRF